MQRAQHLAENLGRMMAVLLVLAGLPLSAQAQTVGLVVDNATKSVTVFDADTAVVLGVVGLPVPAPLTGDCSITQDQDLGFVTDFNARLHVIDLTTSPPSLAPGPNPIPIANNGEDTALSPDGQFLVTCDGAAVQPISVVDIALQAEISSLSLETDCNAVDVCSDGSVLVTSFLANTVRRLRLDSLGSLTDTGERLTLPTSSGNVYCAPDAMSGVVLTSNGLTSFLLPGFTPVATRALSSPNPVSGALTEDRVFAQVRAPSFVDVFAFNSVTGNLGAAPLLQIPIAAPGGLSFFGIDQIAVHPDGAKVYVSEPGVLNVYDTHSGELLGSMSAPTIIEPTGVCLAPEQKAEEDDDHDGVANAVDKCLFSAPGEVVDQTGCSIADLCPCESDWKNHRTYTRCVAHATEDFRATDLMTEAERETVVAAAKQSVCGRKIKKPKKPK